MARYMVDSTSPADALAQPADMYAGYTDGRYVNVGALRAGTDKPVVEISAIGTNSGIVGDCEPGCIWPQNEIVDWVLMRRRSGIEPTVYVGAANLASVVAAFDNAGVARPVAFWTAHYTNTPHYCGEGCSYGRGLGVNVVATQYGGDLIGHYDANTVKDYWPGVDNAIGLDGRGTPLTPSADLGGALTPTVPEDDMSNYLPLFIAGIVGHARSNDPGGAIYLVNPNESTYTWLSPSLLGYLTGKGLERLDNQGADIVGGFRYIGPGDYEIVKAV